MIKAVGLGALALSAGCGMRGVVAADATAPGQATPYVLPDLPYKYDALAPALSEDILRIHHDKHHAGYVKGLNATLAKLEEQRKTGDYGLVKAMCKALAFHGSGHALHALYWKSMKPGESVEPSGNLRAALERDFGSFKAFRDQFVAATNDVEASGWGALAFEPMGRRLLVLQVEKHQDLAFWGAVPLMVCDVWEHAYYLQYQNRRAEYVESFMKIVDWPGTEKRFEAAQKLVVF